MSQNAHPSVVNALAEEFGDNAGLALELYASYRLNPASVDEGWRRAFETAEAKAAGRLETRVGIRATVSGGPRLSLVEAPAPVPAVAPAAPAPRAPASAPGPGEEAIPLTGGAAIVARNMDASLAVPTATSNRMIAAKTMEENRRILNRHREVLGKSKISFTHFVVWGIIRALEKHPGMNDAYGEVDGRPVRIRRKSVNLGIAIDITRKDGSRALLVPNVRGAEALSFERLLEVFDTMVAKTRKGQIEPDSFAGTTISLTNPGTVGTTLSAPRLMPGQGTIIATGAMGYPAEFAAMPEDLLSALGISRVMNVSSTYDHRIIQGAESGQFLATLEMLLLGGDSFYERIFHDLKVPYRPVRFEKDLNPPFFTGGKSLEAVEKQARVGALINAYRVRGHLVANLDPLGGGGDVPYHPDLDPHTYGFTIWDLDREFTTNHLGGSDRASLREILDLLRQTYCGNIGAEFMYNADPVQKQWLMDRMESTRNRADLSDTDRKMILAKLIEAESFEKFLHMKYVGHKRFSLEGGESAIPLLTRLLDRCPEKRIAEVLIGMSHRGRLTVLTTIVGKPVAQIFAEFEDEPDPASIQGSGDVKYHLGAAGTHEAPGGERVAVGLAPNPSHLEAVDPVVEGMVRAKQTRRNDHRDHEKVMPVLLHGDAAFAGQGVVAETLNMSQLHGYRTGGTVHVVVNNQIGFTTSPVDARTSTYCTDVAKMIQAPVFHVNGDDPEAVLRVVDMALDYRCRFKRDVVVDLVCYRRYGHNEGDEPSYTQPLLYQRIKAHPSTARLYGDQLVRQKKIAAEELEALWNEAKEKLQKAYDDSSGGRTKASFVDSLAAPAAPRIEPGLDARSALLKVVRAVSSVPPGFEVHPKLRPVLKKRAEYGSGRPEIDWTGGEMLAFGMLLIHGVPVRLSGQDSGRGTFSQRHAVLADHRTGHEYVPLNHIAEGNQASFEVIDSLLSENAVLGFEFGFSVADPSTLVLWEAQFGDFANGAQVVIDQFISGSEQKWNQRCGLVLLLPHAQEGQGPEHSSARLERFLALAAEENLRLANVSTPAQYYHVLMRQMATEVRKPLVLMSPKSLLRHPMVVSTLQDLTFGAFEPVLDDGLFAAGTDRVRRVVLSSGKMVYDLLAAREKSGKDDVALVRLEQYYPFPGRELGEILSLYPAEADLVWVQEEPRNMGAWRFVREQFLEGLVPGVPASRPLRYVGRRALASPAPGSHQTFQVEQEAIVAEALRVVAPARAVI